MVQSRYFALLIVFLAFSKAHADPPLLLRTPAISRTQVVFSYGGDLWTVPRQGGEARRLTTGSGEEYGPRFSPDGSMIAFTGQYEGNSDVYVVPATGGVPKRLTYHPDDDEVVGWAPGGRILFRSTRSSVSDDYDRLYTVSPDGGFPEELDLPRGFDGSFSPDGRTLAYNPNRPAFEIWKHYRGGLTSAIWIARMSDGSVEEIPRENSNDVAPMWVSDTIYFLSDRAGPVTLFAYDTRTRSVRQVVENHGLDLKSASAGPGAIVYEQFGSLHVLDLDSHADRPLEVRLAGDLPEVRPRFLKVSDRIETVNLSPTGARVVLEARGEILTAPTEKGDIRDITNTPGVAERDPVWSPDGRWIAYFSDESGEYELHVKPQSGLGEARRYALGDPPGFYYSPTWSPDSRKIAYQDERLNLWILELASGKNVKVDTDPYDTPWRTMNPGWSPDSRWLAYTRQVRNHLRAVFIYSLERRKASQITDGLSDARFPAFDRDGQNLFFTASTNAGPSAGWIDMSKFDHPVTRNVYAVVLRADRPSPLAPQSDEEEAGGARKSARKEEDESEEPREAPPEPVRIDLDGIGQRILALPVPPLAYGGLFVPEAGTVLLLETVEHPPENETERAGTRQALYKFDLDSRKLDKLVEGIGGFDERGDVSEGTSTFRLSHDGKKILYEEDEKWIVGPALEPPRPEEEPLKLDEMEVQVDPLAEWRQMYHEAWRIERDFFYDPHHHGLDLVAAEKRYEPYLERLASRSDLNYLFEEMLGELTVGHLFVEGGDQPDLPPVKTGLLGADFTIDRGRYRFRRVYGGENWNPELRAPLTQPGVNVKTGEYLLEVNGRAVEPSEEIYAYFEGTAGKSVVLRVGPGPSRAGSREVTVVPVESEAGLRRLAWIEDNRLTVERLGGGRVGYVYLPNTGDEGYESFNRYYFAQLGKQAVVIDERFNAGGYAADYVIGVMRQPLMNYWATRYGQDFETPIGATLGPKAMIINEYAGSGGDALPWYFRQAGLGPLVGKRTWGGLVGIFGYPKLMDGGRVTAPRIAFYTPAGQWEVENHGVAPDIDVDLDPRSWRAGHDPQLEAAVAAVLDSLAKHPLEAPKRPEYPNYHTGGVGR